MRREQRAGRKPSASDAIGDGRKTLWIYRYDQPAPSVGGAATEGEN
jgi:hypothetical protein